MPDDPLAPAPQAINEWGQFLCTADAPMPPGALGRWVHGDAKLDFEEYNGLAGGGDYEHYTCPHCRKGFYVELPD